MWLARISSFNEQVERSVPRPDREEQVKRNVRIHNERRDSGYTGYAEYRQQRDVVIATLLTSQPDPQRGTKMTASPDMLDKWAASLRQCGPVALVDELQTAPANVELCRVPYVKMNVYFRRWLHIWQHLCDHPDNRVDASMIDKWALYAISQYCDDCRTRATVPFLSEWGWMAINGQYYAAGMGIGVQNTPGGSA